MHISKAKNIILSILVIIMGSTSLSLHAQVDDDKVIMKATKIDIDEVRLRWNFQYYSDWKDAQEYGVRLDRWAIKENGSFLTEEEVVDSYVILDVNIMPFSVSEWSSRFASNDPYAIVGKTVLYDTDPDIEGLKENPTFGDAAALDDLNQERMLLGYFAADQSMHAAEGLVLGHTDTTAMANISYIYRVTISDPDTTLDRVQGIVEFDMRETYELPIITGVTGTGGDRTASIQWNIEDVDDYTSFDVEVSTDNINFQPTDDYPFIFMSENENAATASFADSLAENNVPYYYRIVGRTPFETKGPPSESIMIQGTPDRILSLIFFMDSYTIDEEAGETILHRTTLTEEQQPLIVGYEISVSADPILNFTKVDVGTISTETNNITVPTIEGSRYYKLTAIDLNGHRYDSPTTLVQTDDEEPPAIPSGLQATFLTNNTAEISWDANSEADLKGYRVFFSNGKASVFTQISSSIVTTNSFYYDIDPTFLVDSIFFTVLSTDQRENNSERAEPIGITRPDITPPSSPVLAQASPTPNGVYIGWKLSETSDVVYHELQRKLRDENDWSTIETITIEQEENYEVNLTPDDVLVTNYIDSSQLDRRYYQYRILAYDDADNVASSDRITVRPYDSGKRGEVTDVAVSVRLRALFDEDDVEEEEPIQLQYCNYKRRKVSICWKGKDYCIQEWKIEWYLQRGAYLGTCNNLLVTCNDNGDQNSSTGRGRGNGGNRWGNNQQKYTVCYQGEEMCIKKNDLNWYLTNGAYLGSCNSTYQYCSPNKRRIYMCKNGETNCVAIANVQFKLYNGWKIGACSDTPGITEEDLIGYNLLQEFIIDYETKGTLARNKLEHLWVCRVITRRELNELLDLDDIDIYEFLVERKLELFATLLIPEITIEWTYESSELLKDFQIYRSIGGSAIALYKTIPADGTQISFSYTDTDIIKGNRYVYQIAARHRDGGFSMLSDVRMIKVQQ